MRELVYIRLATDSAFITPLTGGVYKAWEVTEIHRQRTPSAFDASSEIMPCCLLREDTASPRQPKVGAGDLFFSLYFYQRYGEDEITISKDRAFTLLDQWISIPDQAFWRMEHSGDVLGAEDDALRSHLLISRYKVVRRRS